MVVFLLSLALSYASAERVRPAAELKRLEHVLSRAQDARQAGRLEPERYEKFLVQFRASLQETVAGLPSSPENIALHARILSRLGDPEQALAALAPALEADPQNPDLRATSGYLRFERGDVEAALGEADAALERDPANPVALAVKKLSEGRSSGRRGEIVLPPAGQGDGASESGNPAVMAAAKQATARTNANHYVAEAFRRINIGDPKAALRYLALAEGSDPTLADVPMQQGLAHRALRENAVAAERFARAESMWRAAGDRESRSKAELARQGKAQAASAASLAESSRAPADGTPRAPARRAPLVPAGAGLTVLGMGWGLKKRREGESLISPAAMTTIGVGLLAVSAFLPPTAPVLAPVAGPAVATTASALAPAAAGTLGSFLTALGIKRQAESLVSRAQASEATAEPERGTASSPNDRESLDRKLRALENAQKKASRKRILPDGRVRYYEPERPARNPGPTRGNSFVTEHDPKTGNVRQWMESYDHSGKVLRVHPKTINGQEVDSFHYPPTGKELGL